VSNVSNRKHKTKAKPSTASLYCRAGSTRAFLSVNFGSGCTYVSTVSYFGYPLAACRVPRRSLAHLPELPTARNHPAPRSLIPSRPTRTLPLAFRVFPIFNPSS
jgi:hypothetical protein